MKRLILIGDDGVFLEWGPGCVLRIEASGGEGDGRWLLIAGTHSFALCLGEFAREQQARTACQLWLQAILFAADGGLLCWDDAKQAVVDELSEGDYFSMAAEEEY